MPKDTEPKEIAPKRPFFASAQDFIYNIDVGSGAQMFRVALFVLLTIFVVLIYTASQFYGLRDVEAMDAAQLARQLSRGEGYTTKFLRPLSLWHMWANTPQRDARLLHHPELTMPPGHPFVLSGVLRATKALVDPNDPDYRPYNADRVVMAASWFFFLASLALMYVLGKMLFDQRVATLSAFVLLFSDGVLQLAMSGLPVTLLMFLFLLLSVTLVKLQAGRAAQRDGKWGLPLLGVAAAVVGIGTLVAYNFCVLFLPLALYAFFIFRKQRYLALALVVVVFALLLLPWCARNWQVSRTVFGLAPRHLVEGTPEYRRGETERSYEEVKIRYSPRRIAGKMLVNFHRVYDRQIKNVGENYVIIFFLAALLHPFRRTEAVWLRRVTVLGGVLAALWWCAVGAPHYNTLTIFFPVMVLYACAFFYLLFDRLQLTTRLTRAAAIGAFGFANGLSFLLTVLPPAATPPYPPYQPAVAALMNRTFRADEILMSDQPWSVAWYADRATVWLPKRFEDFYRINDNVHIIAGLYLTQLTLEGQSVSDMLAGEPQIWLALFLQRSPDNFPLQMGAVLTPDNGQILLTARPRLELPRPPPPGAGAVP
jgi:hypothetical protein